LDFHDGYVWGGGSRLVFNERIGEDGMAGRVRAAKVATVVVTLLATPGVVFVETDTGVADIGNKGKEEDRDKPDGVVHLILRAGCDTHWHGGQPMIAKGRYPSAATYAQCNVQGMTDFD
jgi:hypothetical protein